MSAARLLRLARRWVAAPALQVEDRRRARAIVAAPPAASDRIAVSYGVDDMPGPGAVAAGGFVKFQRLAEALPNVPRAFNVLYLGSSSAPRDAGRLIRAARQRGAKVAWNQNGVAYPAWHGAGWEQANRRMAALMREADHVFYQSTFCKETADRYLGAPAAAWEILHNAVDTAVFAPAPAARDARLTLLVPGNQYSPYKVERAVDALALVAREQPDAQLLVTGWLRWPSSTDPRRDIAERARALGVADRVHFLGAYRQADAPALYRRAHVLLHAKVGDPCPNAVIESMACGTPVVYAASGGVPELVGDAAGIGVPSATTFEQDVPPDAAGLAEAVLAVVDRHADFAAAARERAVECFDIGGWIQRHRVVFEQLLS